MAAPAADYPLPHRKITAAILIEGIGCETRLSQGVQREEPTR